MSDKKNLVVYEVQYRKKQRMWVLTTGGALVCSDGYTRKANAVRWAAEDLENMFRAFGQESELQIRNLNGTYAPARTYGHDPKSPG